MVLNSLHKYQPCIHIVRIDSQSGGGGGGGNGGGGPLEHKLNDAFCALKSSSEGAGPYAHIGAIGGGGGADEDSSTVPSGLYLHECAAEYLATGRALDSFGRSKKIVSCTFPETQFIAVTAYQNEDVRM